MLFIIGANMQNVSIQIQDSFFQDFLRLIEPYRDKITLKHDKNLEYDPSFYARRESLHRTREEIKDGQGIPHTQLWGEIKEHLQAQ
jgi:hypothetical protein